MRHDVITLSREYGAGASELAGLLRQQLGWPILDEEITQMVAAELGLPHAFLEEWDEHSPGFLESFGNALRLGSPDMLMDPSYVARPSAPDIVRATRDVVQRAADAAPVILVGHGAQVILQDRPRTLHLRLVAPPADRCRRVMQRRGGTVQQAMSVSQHVDRDRTHYVKELFGRDLHDPLLYTLQINTGAMTMRDVVALVMCHLDGTES
ncbi:MAG: cytidylate kinase-like family protein [bacterium]